MSKYEVDKVCWQTSRDDKELDRYLADPAKFLEGCDLSPTEREAILKHDFVTLYRLGAHPLLLQSWHRIVDKAAESPNYVEMWAQAVTPYGRPDFST